jgi:hypothetical protein
MEERAATTEACSGLREVSTCEKELKRVKGQSEETVYQK